MHQRDVAALDKFRAIYKEYRSVPVPKFPSCNCERLKSSSDLSPFAIL